MTVKGNKTFIYQKKWNGNWKEEDDREEKRERREEKEEKRTGCKSTSGKITETIRTISLVMAMAITTAMVMAIQSGIVSGSE